MGRSGIWKSKGNSLCLCFKQWSVHTSLSRHCQQVVFSHLCLCSKQNCRFTRDIVSMYEKDELAMIITSLLCSQCKSADITHRWCICLHANKLTLSYMSIPQHDTTPPSGHYQSNPCFLEIWRMQFYSIGNSRLTWDWVQLCVLCHR